MKFQLSTVSLLFTALFSSAALATPALGDSVVYERLVNGQLQDSVEIKLIGYKPEYQIFYKQTTIRRGTQSQVSYEPVAAHRLMNDQMIGSALKNCTQNGGREEVLSVGSSNLRTCRMPLHEESAVGEQWIGAIPFGLARLSYDSGEDHIEMKAVSFVFGQP